MPWWRMRCRADYSILIICFPTPSWGYPDVSARGMPWWPIACCDRLFNINNPLLPPPCQGDILPQALRPRRNQRCFGQESAVVQTARMPDMRKGRFGTKAFMPYYRPRPARTGACPVYHSAARQGIDDPRDLRPRQSPWHPPWWSAALTKIFQCDPTCPCPAPYPGYSNCKYPRGICIFATAGREDFFPALRRVYTEH